jgi:hypothetical protein
MLYSNAIPSDRLTVLDTESHAFRTVALKAPVRAAFATPDAKHAIALLSPPEGSARAGAFSLLPIQQALPPKLQGTDAPVQGVAMVNSNAVITTRAANTFGAFVVGFPSLSVDPLSLPSAPTSSGIVEEAGMAFVAQEHPEGRLTFAPLTGGSPRTLTGFELGVKVTDGDD